MQESYGNVLSRLKMFLSYLIFRVLTLTYKIEHIDVANRDKAGEHHPKGGFILTAWHEHVIMLIASQVGVPFHPIVSRSGMGQFVGYVCKKLGYTPYYGSQSRDGVDKGGGTALLGLFRSLKKGAPIAITVDGSVGPRRVVKDGSINLASRGRAPILPAAMSADRYWELNTWDRLKVPKPFAQVTVIYGSPIELPPKLSFGEVAYYQDEVAKAINDLEYELLTR